MGNYYFAKDDKKVFFKLTGMLRYTTCSHFDAFLDSFLADASDVEEVAIDLTEAEFLDSTNLGFLARIAQFMLDKNGSVTTIYCTSDDIKKTLCSVGFDEIFRIVDGKGDMDEKFGMIDPAKFDQKDKTLMMIDAHKCLMSVNEKNQKTFKDVVSLMEQSLRGR